MSQKAAPQQVQKKQETRAAPARKHPNHSWDNQEYLVEEFAIRWNYALPAYPPADFSYKSQLKQQKLNEVTYEQFQKMKYMNPEESKTQKDKKSSTSCERDQLMKLFEPNMTLVHQIDHYEGVYRDKEGKAYDLRPDTDEIVRPCKQTFINMPQIKLQKLLLTAYETQLKELESADHSPYDLDYE